MAKSHKGTATKKQAGKCRGKAAASKAAPVDTSTVEAGLASQLAPTRVRTQGGRRDFVQKVERALEDKLGRYSKLQVETTYIEGNKRAREFFTEDIKKTGHVLKATSNAVSQKLDQISGTLSMLKPENDNEEVTDALLSAVEIACDADNKIRSPEPIMLYLSHCRQMSEQTSSDSCSTCGTAKTCPISISLTSCTRS
jgi:hypothetical protein